MQIKPTLAAAVAAFADTVQRLTEDDATILLAVSGGPDSLAMLLLAHKAMPERIHAATIDHGLRPEAADETLYVAALCASLAVPHFILRPETAIGGSIQASARAVRYALLQAHAASSGCRWIATAHHADDQLETVLMRVARGSGIDGLAAVREKQGQIIRPLLALRKVELEQVCADVGVVPLYDPSNDNAEFDRVAMRKWLAQTAHPFDAARAVRTAAALTDASEALRWMTDRTAESHFQRADDLAFDPQDFPNELRRRLLLRALDEIQPGYIPRGEAADRALIALKSGEKFTIGNILCEGGAIWRFRVAPKRRQ